MMRALKQAMADAVQNCRCERHHAPTRRTTIAQKSTNMLVLAALFQRRRFMTGTATTALVGL